MTPKSFSIKNGKTIFHYSYKDLKEFVKIGMDSGAAGMILVSRKDNLITLRGYGTIENPNKYLASLTYVHFPMFDGEMKTDEERLIPPKPFFTKENTRMVILKMTEEEKKNIVKFKRKQNGKNKN